MKKFWTELTTREQLLITVCGAIFVAFAAFQFVFSPFVDWRKNASAKAERAEEIYELVAKASAFGGPIDNNEDRDLETPLRNALTQTASPNAINLNFVNVRADGKIDASAASTNPDDLFSWFEILEQQYGVFVESADISRERGESGAVRAQLTFSR